MAEIEIDQEREKYLDLTQKVELAWKEVDDLKNTIARLDRDIAKLKDDNGSLIQQRDGVVNSFQELYQKHDQLIQLVLNAIQATVITTGKLSEGVARYKFIIPEATADNKQQ